MTQQMYKTLDSFFADRIIDDIDRHSFLTCNLIDTSKKITICLIFLRDWDSLETDSYNVVVLENKGAVFTFPGYWISVPKELAMPYFEYIIKDFYDSEVSKWGNGSSDNNSNGSTSGNNCPCPVPQPPVPPNPNCKFI